MSALGENILLQVFLTVVILFVAKSQALSRFFLLAYCVLLLAALLSWRIFLTVLLARLRKRGRNSEPDPDRRQRGSGQEFFRLHHGQRPPGLQGHGFRRRAAAARLRQRVPRRDRRQLAQVLEREKVDEVVIALPNSAIDKIGPDHRRLREFSGPGADHPRLFQVHEPAFRDLALRKFSAHFHPRQSPGTAALAAFEKGLRPALHPVWRSSSFFPGCGRCWRLLIKISSPGPVFFKQERWGDKKRADRLLQIPFHGQGKPGRG